MLRCKPINTCQDPVRYDDRHLQKIKKKDLNRSTFFSVAQMKSNTAKKRLFLLAGVEMYCISIDGETHNVAIRNRNDIETYLGSEIVIARPDGIFRDELVCPRERGGMKTMDITVDTLLECDDYTVNAPITFILSARKTGKKNELATQACRQLGILMPYGECVGDVLVTTSWIGYTSPRRIPRDLFETEELKISTLIMAIENSLSVVSDCFVNPSVKASLSQLAEEFIPVCKRSPCDLPIGPCNGRTDESSVFLRPNDSVAVTPCSTQTAEIDTVIPIFKRAPCLFDDQEDIEHVLSSLSNVVEITTTSLDLSISDGLIQVGNAFGSLWDGPTDQFETDQNHANVTFTASLDEMDHLSDEVNGDNKIG